MPRRSSNWRHLLPALGLPYLVALGAHAALSPDPAAKTPPFSFRESNILGTSLDLQVATASEKDAEKAHAAVLAEIDRLRKILSTYEPATDISRANASKEPVHVAQELIDVLHLYEQWQAKTKGAYTAGLGELVKLWKKAEQDSRPPDPATLAALVANLQKPLFKIDDKAHTVQRLTDQTLNVDSLGKGFIVSQAANVARKDVPSLRGILLNIGGDITALGSAAPSGPFAPWHIGVANPAHPEDNAPPLTELQITAVSVATSGSYERGYQVADKKYSHLLDPRSGNPVDFHPATAPTVVSATAIAPDNSTANALAASLCILPPADGLALVRSAGADCLLVLSDGSQQRSPGFKRYELPNSPNASPAPTPSADPAPAVKTPSPAAPPAPEVAAASGGFPKDYQLAMTLILKPAKNRPYVAVWIESDKGQYIKTLAMWGNEAKYQKGLNDWWKWVKSDNTLLASVSRATRPTDKSYVLTWDGTDDKGKPVAEGAYKVWVETAAEHAGLQKAFTTITCGPEKATATIKQPAAAGNSKQAPQFDDATLVYGPKGT